MSTKGGIVSVLIATFLLIWIMFDSIPTTEEWEEQQLIDIEQANIFCQEQGYYSIDEGGVNYVMGTDGSKFVRCMYEDGHLSDYKNFNGGGLSFFPIFLIIVVACVVICILVVFKVIEWREKK